MRDLWNVLRVIGDEHFKDTIIEFLTHVLFQIPVVEVTN